MRVLLAPDKFKGSLSAAQVAAQLTAGLQAVDPTIEIITSPVADGGDGTLDAALAAGFERMDVDANGPTGRLRRAAYARRDTTAVVELACVCGLALLPPSELEPLRASSLGLGTVLRAALDAGAARIVLGIGGSASTDGGAGLLQALGACLLDGGGQPLALGGGALSQLARVDLGELHPRLAEVELVVASDVDNPLYGPNGAAAVYGPQKGASPEQVDVLDRGLRHLAALVHDAISIDYADEPGAGAAGGVGFGALVLGAQLCSGIDLMLELVGFQRALDGVDLVITGEGSLDGQTLAGKAPAGVARAARRRGRPVFAVAGRASLTAAQLASAGIDRVYSLTELEPDLARCMAEAGPLLRAIGERIAHDLLLDHQERA